MCGRNNRMPWWAWAFILWATHFSVFWIGWFMCAAFAAGAKADEKVDE